MAVEAHHYLFAFGDASVGLYLHIALLWLQGHLPYLVAWEYKPPGLFAYYALALAASGGRATLAVELLATLSAFATAVLVWRLAPLVDRTGSARSGRYAALFCVLLAPENEGFLGDAELLLAPFIAAALLVACSDVTLATALLGGLLAGCALQMKLSALPLVAIPLLVMLKGARQPFAVAAAYVAAALSPFVLEAALYARAGALPAFIDANAGATLRRLAGLHGGVVRENLVWFGAQLRVLAPALELAPFALSASVNGRRIASWGWFAAALLSIVAVGEFYDRQFVLIEAPIALLGGIGLRAVLDGLRSRRPLRRVLVVVVFLLTFALHDYWETAQAVRIAYVRFVRHDATYGRGSYATLLEALRERTPRSLFVVQESPLLYDDLGVPSPTRFPYTDHLLDPRMMQMTGVSGTAEIARIFARQPNVVVVGDLSAARFAPDVVASLEERLKRDYHMAGELDAHTSLYVRTAAPVASPSRPK